MQYQQTINYLFTKLPMFSKIGSAAYKANLNNTIALAQFLHHPQNSFITIHVAGTNGKGSVSHMLAAILQQAGYKTGLYTSPHLQDFRERIKVNGKLCSQDFVVQFTEKLKPLIETVQPSFFEITVAMAFSYFKEQQVDVAVIETGLGGRLDSTNIINPILSIITNIGYDHVQILGNTLPQIAFEKAGIIKKETPVVIGEIHEETKEVFITKAKQENAPIFFAEECYQYIHHQLINHRLSVTYLHKANNHQKTIVTDLGGIYQIKNIATVLTAVEKLQQLQFNITQNTIEQALQKVIPLTGLHGRWQILQTNPIIIADVAHNAHGMQQVLRQLQQLQYNRLHIILGMVKDKDVAAVLQLLPANATYYFTQANIPRALNKEELQQAANTFNLRGNVFNNVNMAIENAVNQTEPNDLILICGSVFLVGEIDYSKFMH